MKKLMTLMLGLSFLVATTAPMFGQEPTKKEGKKKGKKKKTDDTKKS